MQRAKLVNMATAVEEMFRKMFSRDDDGPLIKFLCLCFSWSCVTALSAVKGSITKEAWKISKIPEFYERIFFNCFFPTGNYILRDLSKEDREASIAGHLPFP